MKKIFAIVSAFAALVACTKVAPVVDDSLQEENQEIKVNFTISREDDNTGTKASVKTAFSENDVVFIFFKGLNAPKRLEMKYTGSSWTPTFYGDIQATDLTDGGTLTAIYLPYGSGITVDGTEETFTFSEAYKGYYLLKQMTYEFKSNTITAAISLQVAPPTSGSDVIVHFDVSGLSSTHEYNMYQEYVKPLTLTAISNTGTVDQTVGAAGDAILGHQDAGFVSFSGVLDASAVGAGNAKTYQFFVRDETLGTLYYRTTASAKPISANSYIGLGSAATSPWAVASPGAFSVSATDQITFARSNLSYLGATGGDKPWQLMKYPWSTIETAAMSPFTPSSSVDFSLFGWATSGYNGNNPWNYGTDDTVFGPSMSDSAPEDDRKAWYNKYAGKEWYIVEPETTNWDWAKYNTVYEYGGALPIGSGWRTPTRDEFIYILFSRSNDYRCARATVGSRPGVIIFPDGYALTSGITINHPNIAQANSEATREATYAENTYTNLQWNKLEANGAVFFPVAGYRNGTNNQIVNYNTYGGYATSTIGDRKYRHLFVFDHQGSTNSCVFTVYGVLRRLGTSVRLVRNIPAE